MQNSCEWRPTHPFPNEYRVSSDGRVFSIRANRIIKPNHDKHGYLYYVLCVDGARRTVKAHRLVANAFIPNPDGKPTVNHRNGIRDDNRADNLEWATSMEQTHDPLTKRNLDAAHKRTNYQEMGAKRNFGRKPVSITWPDGKAEFYPSLLKAARATGVNYGHLSETLNGKRPQRKEFAIAVTKRHFPEEAENDRPV